MDYKKEIISLLKQIKDKQALRYLYIVVKDLVNDLNKQK